MEHSEMIEKLHNQAGIANDDAERALEQAGWDMLGALQILEREGKIAPLTSSMTTVEDKSGYEEVKRTASKNTHRSQNAARFSEKIKEILLYSMNHSFLIKRKNEIILNIPLLIMIVILLCAPKTTLVALLAGLFFECGYSVEKNNFGSGSSDN